jgi:16S rRNA (guanine1207-N2)-methyltransferase
MLTSQIHKRINFNFDKQKLILDTSQELFSFAKVDEGTKELLNSLRKNQNLNYQKVLDLGCGYGVIGIFIKNKFPQADILCTDRDSLAVEFAEHNAELNSLKINAISSLDFQAIPGKFSLILTNFPAKLEKEGLEYFIARSSEHLEKEGNLILVIVKELNLSMEEIIKNENIKVTFKEKSKNYSVYHLQFTEKMPIPKNPYNLEEKMFIMAALGANMLVSNALQEFDTPHFITQLISEKITLEEFNPYKEITILNPGQGLIPISSAYSCSRNKIILASRDLLQLKISGENLKLNAVNYFEEVNSDFPQNKGDILIWSLHDESTKEILEKLFVFRKNFKKIILGGRIQVINRVLQNLKIEPKKEIRGKYCVVEI